MHFAKITRQTQKLLKKRKVELGVAVQGSLNAVGKVSNPEYEP